MSPPNERPPSSAEVALGVAIICVFGFAVGFLIGMIVCRTLL